MRLRRPCRPGALPTNAPGLGNPPPRPQGSALGKRGRRLLRDIGRLTSDRGPEGEKVEHAERLAAGVAPGDACEAVEVDHVFTVGAEVMGHVQRIG